MLRGRGRAGSERKGLRAGRLARAALTHPGGNDKGADQSRAVRAERQGRAKGAGQGKGAGHPTVSSPWANGVLRSPASLAVSLGTTGLSSGQQDEAEVS